MFFTIHDPTTPNRQGNDVGTQYRSVIFCQIAAQRATAKAVIEELTAKKLWRNPIVTEIAGAAPFYEAEAYHQEYFDAEPAAALLRRSSSNRRSPSFARSSPIA